MTTFQLFSVFGIIFAGSALGIGILALIFNERAIRKLRDLFN